MWSPEVRAPGRLTEFVAGLVAATAVLLLAGCGFHPRGETPLPAEMAVIYIHGTQEFDTLYDDFRTALESRGARVTQNRTEASAVLDILESNFDKTVLTVDLGGKVLEYRLLQNIQFDVTAADGRTLLDRQSVTMSRALKFNRNDLLGKEREGELFRRELQRDVVNLAMLRIAAASRH